MDTNSTAVHTPTPWKLDGHVDIDANGVSLGLMLWDGIQNERFTPVGPFTPIAVSKANAAHIVACVNGWDALTRERDALREALEEVGKRLAETPIEKIHFTGLISKIGEALSAARKGE